MIIPHHLIPRHSLNVLPGGMKVLDHIREEVTAQQTFVGQALAELLDKGFLEQVLAYRPSIVNDVCYLFHFYHSADGSDDAAPRAFIHSSNCLINLSKGETFVVTFT